MTRLLVIALLLGGCSPLAAYTHSWSYTQELFGKDAVEEAKAYAADIERREAGYPVDPHPGVFPYRNATPRDKKAE